MSAFTEEAEEARPQALEPGPKEILIIEDSATVRLYLRKVLESAFPAAKLSEADDGWAALKALGRGSVQLIVSDLNMPRMDGKAFIQTLRRNSVLRRKPVLLISSEAVSEPELQSDPLLRFLLKPASPEAITAAAKDLILAVRALQRPRLGAPGSPASTT